MSATVLLVGFWRRLAGLEANDLVTGAPRFAVDANSIPAQVFGLEGYTDTVSPVGRVSRMAAIQCGSVARARDLIPGTLGGLPIDCVGPDFQPVTSTLFEQPEADVPRSVTMVKTFEDMFFDEIAWWRVTERGWHGFPTKVRRLESGTVDVRKDQKVYVAPDGRSQGSAWEWVPDADLIRFDSPTPGLLTKAARAIRTALAMEAAAAKHADGTPAVDYFVPAEDAEELDDDEIAAFLAKHRAAREAGTTGYYPAAVKLMAHGWNPEQLQLKDMRDQAVVEIARHAGLDPEDLGVSTTSRTYQNGSERRLALVDFTLAQFLIAMSDRLSMNDVCPRGYRASIRIENFTRADVKSRYEAYEIGLRIGAITRPEIRVAERQPAIEQPDQPAAPAPEIPRPTAVPDLPGAHTVAASTGTSIGFAEEPSLRLDMPSTTAATFEVDRERRVIRGLLVPYGVPGWSLGRRWQFSRGSLTWAAVSRVKLWIQHDSSQAVGAAFELDDREDGLYGAFKVANTPEGDRALTLADDKDGAPVLDGFSIGIGDGGKFSLSADGVYHAITAPLMETSLTPSPSFDDARVHAVAASAANTKGTTVQCNQCGQVHADGVTTCQSSPQFTVQGGQPQPVTQPQPQPQAQPQATHQAGPIDFSPVGQALSGALASHFNGGQQGQPQAAAPAAVVQQGPQLAAPEPVAAGGRPIAQVTKEEPLYRFDGLSGKHDFSTDLISGLKFGNGEAMERVQSFITEQFSPRFDVDSGNVSTLNPAKHRPDMYVDKLEYTTPVYDVLYKGTLEDVTPFVFPKFAASADLVNPHVEGVEPNPGSFSATNQTVTPSPVSGKVEITREVWDQGGNPQVSGLIWREMVRAYYEALEAKGVALLDAAAPTQIPLTAGAEDDVLVNELEAEIAKLQFIRGGMRFRFMPTHVDLYLKLAAAVGADGRKLLPMIGPSNVNGGAEPLFSSLVVAGVRSTPSWALGASGAVSESSYLLNPADVHLWNSAPRQLTFDYRVAYVDLAIWGYVAGAISRLDGVREITYDPVA